MYYLYGIRYHRPTYTADGKDSMQATQVSIIAGPEKVPDPMWRMVVGEETPVPGLPTDYVIGTGDDIRKAVDAGYDSRLILRYVRYDDTALVDLFPDKEILIVEQVVLHDYSMLRRDNTTFAYYVHELNEVMFDPGMVKGEDFVLRTPEDKLKGVLKEYKGRVWRDIYRYGWGDTRGREPEEPR